MNPVHRLNLIAAVVLLAAAASAEPSNLLRVRLAETTLDEAAEGNRARDRAGWHDTKTRNQLETTEHADAELPVIGPQIARPRPGPVLTPPGDHATLVE